LVAIVINGYYSWWTVRWDIQTPATPKGLEVSTFVSMALVVGAGHMLAPEAKSKLVVGGALRARPKVQAVWYGLMSSAPEATTAELLKWLGALEIEGDIVSGSPSQWPNWPRYLEGPTDSLRTFTSSFKLVAKAAKVPADQWGATYISLLHGYAATIAISYLDEVADATFESLLAHVMDTMERQHVQANKTALETRVLGPNEDLGDFANSLRVLTRQAYDHVYKPPQVEERAGEAFVRGLTGLLKQRVREEFPESLDKAVSLAKNRISRLDKVVAPVAPGMTGPGAAMGGSAWNHGQTGNHGGGFQGPQGFRPSNGSSQGTSRPSTGARPKTDLVCWHCGLKGHTKAKCRKKTAANAAARHGPSKNGREPGSYQPPESQ
jgi:hypothetical protein